ncbi:hypothetical protein T440DRAFT_387753 [Plenodomus tracheiphilus IPT5]|uniref:Uncharacterized protein n=1 Tax=Plenodomus tracheiphilus IPT5 TaxID=1408161 RepID=A0A6A7BIA3_9PLEO|nr:hypothetical protein T440DRAFT_387753 [Plenodomus tracheiphilus IPT5]
MTFSRAYVPSKALITALSRPQPIRCSFARAIATQPQRGKRTKATSERPGHSTASTSRPPVKQQIESVESRIRDMSHSQDDDNLGRPLTDKELEADDLPVINLYEQDIDRGTPKRLIERLETKADWKRDQEMYRMIVESQGNPDYDDTKLNKRLLDSLISNPNFADLAEELKDMKQGIKSKAEMRALEEAAAKQAEPDEQQVDAGLRIGTHEMLQKLIDDPDFGPAKAELEQVVDKLPEIEDFGNSEFQDMLLKAMETIDKDPVMQKKMAAMTPDSSDPKFEKEWAEFAKGVEETMSENENEDNEPALETPTDLEDMNQLLHQMRDVLKSIGGDSALEAELDAVLSEDPDDAQDEAGSVDLDREMDPEQLAEEIQKLTQLNAPQPERDEEEDIPADVQAKVDKIMQDPRLMEKLMYIQKLIEEQRQADPTIIPHETAPDPYELDDSRTATLQERMDAVRQDPEHVEALDRLRVKLQPPFNIAPALKSFNQAIELAYVGANDDVRRVLWRAYQKARSLPTFLQNMSDDAWDILYYSQAVTWGSNQNRQAHLRTLLADLRSLGRDGPPTHPSTLVRNGDGADLKH